MRQIFALLGLVALVQSAALHDELEALKAALNDFQENRAETNSRTYIRHNAATQAKSASNDDKPNVLFILADDLGYNDIGYNNAEVKSPNLDKLAKEGVILTNNYVQPVCTPSRSTLMTGRLPFKAQVQHMVLGETMPHCVPTNLKFLPERFQDLGYETFAVGKWHMGFCKEDCLPTKRGFDHFYGCYSGAEDYYTHMAGAGYDWRDDDEVDRSVDGDYHSYIVNDYVVNTLKDMDEDDSFFMYVSFTNVHTPLQAPKKFIDMYPDISEPRKTYLAMMSAMDESVGNIVATLKDQDLYDNTIIIFSSDNGGESGGHADNSPLRGGKASLYDGGSRVVGFVHSKLLENPGTTHDGLFHISDWTNTLMGMVGGTVDNNLDGFDQSDMIKKGGQSKRQEIIYNIDMQPMKLFGQAAVRVGDFKLIWGHPGFVDGRGKDLTIFYRNPANIALLGMSSRSANITARNTQMQSKGGAFAMTPQDQSVVMGLENLWNFDKNDITSGRVELFNLKDDPNEYTDLSGDASYAQTITSMKQYILTLLNDYVAPHSEASVSWETEADPAKYGGAWTTGWCENVDILV